MRTRIAPFRKCGLKVTVQVDQLHPRLLNPRGFPAPADGYGRRAIHAFPKIIGKLIADDLDVDDPHTGTRN